MFVERRVGPRLAPKRLFERSGQRKFQLIQVRSDAYRRQHRVPAARIEAACLLMPRGIEIHHVMWIDQIEAQQPGPLRGDGRPPLLEPPGSIGRKQRIKPVPFLTAPVVVAELLPLIEPVTLQRVAIAGSRLRIDLAQVPFALVRGEVAGGLQQLPKRGIEARIQVPATSAATRVVEDSRLQDMLTCVDDGSRGAAGQSVRLVVHERRTGVGQATSSGKVQSGRQRLTCSLSIGDDQQDVWASLAARIHSPYSPRRSGESRASNRAAGKSDEALPRHAGVEGIGHG